MGKTKQKETRREKTRAFLKRYTSSAENLDSLNNRKRAVEKRGGDNTAVICQIEEQTKLCNELMFEIQGLLAHLPAGSRKYNVMAMKYLDGLNWFKISNALYLSESAVRKLETQAIDELSVYLE